MKRCAFGAFVLVLTLPAWAGDYEQIRERLEALVGSTSDVTVAETPVPGILQARIGSDIVYISEDARYLLQGRLLDLETREDLTDKAMSDVRKELISELDKSRLIQYGSDDLAHEIVVFTDVDCGYCRRLHQQVEEYNDAGIQVNYAAFPRAGIDSETFRKMDSVWCAADQQAAMDLAKSGGRPSPAECDSPIADQYQLGQALGVTGTPALVTLDGDLIPGYVPPQDLRERLDQLAASRGGE